MCCKAAMSAFVAHQRLSSAEVLLCEMLMAARAERTILRVLRGDMRSQRSHVYQESWENGVQHFRKGYAAFLLYLVVLPRISQQLRFQHFV